MKNFQILLKNTLTDFQRNKVRTGLTSLGILIGVLSVVLLIAIGLGLKNYISQQFEGLGANLVFILPGSGFGGGGFGSGIVGGAKFDERDYNSLKNSGAEFVAPVFMKSLAVESQDEKARGTILGTNEQTFRILNVKTIAGEEWDKTAVSGRLKVAYLGEVIATNLFKDPQNAVGRTIRVDRQRYKVVGVAEKRGDNEQDNGVWVPYKTTFGSLNPDKNFFAIYLGVATEEEVPQVKKDAENILSKRYKKDDFSVTEQSQILSTINQIFSIINVVLIAIGSISLLVGGIGIMNIMYANVTERTKEVGIKRAIGATKQDILVQFLLESVILSLAGGIIGLLLASIIVLIVRNFFPVAINFFAVTIAIGVSTAIGVFFGVFPARRAANLTPIEAIRYE